MAKALALLSGGLDSILSIRLIQQQGIPVEAIHFVSLFNCGSSEMHSCAGAKRAAEMLGVPIHFENISEELLGIVKNPKHGYGSNMNPCIDCHAMMFRRARKLMPQIGADFLITGEVLGERPMSQRRDALRVVEREAGVEGLLLRPLSAKLLDPTIPEQKGWVHRNRLEAISGRCRKPQLALAKALGIEKFPSPAGGCLLTDPGFADRMRDLLKHQPDCTVEDVRLLKIGRHFRLGPATKLVVGRNEDECRTLRGFAVAADTFLEAADFSGALALLRGPATDEQLNLAASITLRYGKAAAQPSARVRIWRHGSEPEAARILTARAATEEMLDRMRIGPGRG